jgi:hypothetical protein
MAMHEANGAAGHLEAGTTTIDCASADAYNEAVLVQVSMRRIRWSTTMALILSILGSSVLPMSYAFATTGILSGCLISVVRKPSHDLFACNVRCYLYIVFTIVLNCISNTDMTAQSHSVFLHICDDVESGI